MKLSDILLITLFFVMGSMIFAIKQKQKSLGNDGSAIPVPAVKPAPPQMTAIPELRLQLSTPETAGSYGRLSLEQFLAKGQVDVITRDVAPMSSAATKPLRSADQPTPRVNQDMPPAPQSELLMPDSEIRLDKAQPINLPYIPAREETLFIDRVTQMAEASPLQPDSRGCGTLNQNIKRDAKHAKVRSVGMARQLTENASIGVEYVYKDGCYKKAIATLPLGNMPSDDGVNLRVNMRF